MDTSESNDNKTNTAAVLPELPCPEDPGETVTREEYQKMKEWFDAQIKEMSSNYDAISSQFKEFKNTVVKDDALTQRVERLVALMTHHMTYFRQLVELVDSYGDRIVANERAMNNIDLKFATLAQKQSQFSQVVSELRRNTNAIIGEIEKLHEREDANDKFKFKITAVFAICGGVIAWLLAGDNLTNVALFLNGLFGNGSGK